MVGFACALMLVRSAVHDWIENPTGKHKVVNLFESFSSHIKFIEVGIETFSLPVTELTYPAITICKRGKFHDPGTYIRTVFNNFQYSCHVGDDSCNKTAFLRRHYRHYIGLGRVRKYFFYWFILE